MDSFFKSNFFYFLVGQMTIIAVMVAMGTVFFGLEAQERNQTAEWRSVMEARMGVIEGKGKQLDVLKQKVDKPK